MGRASLLFLAVLGACAEESDPELARRSPASPECAAIQAEYRDAVLAPEVAACERDGDCIIVDGAESGVSLLGPCATVGNAAAYALRARGIAADYFAEDCDQHVEPATCDEPPPRPACRLGRCTALD